MISLTEQLHTHYEFAMAIGTSLDLKAMLRKSISTFLRKMNCQAGGVHFLKQNDNGKQRFAQVFSIPRDTSRIKEYQAALKELCVEFDDRQLTAFKSTLPLHGQERPGKHFYIVELPEIGILILLKNGNKLDPLFIKSLGPLFSKLATACRACIQNQELLRHRDKLEDLVLERSRELITRNQQLIEKINDRREAEERFRLAAEATSDLIYEWNIHDDMLQWFGDIDVALGYEPGEFDHNIAAWVERIHPDDLARLSDAVERHRTSREPISYEYQIQRKDGSLRCWSDYGVPVLGEGGRPFKWIGVCKDITNRKQAEQELRESEERYRSLFTNEIDSISIFEADTRKIVDVNDAFLTLYGYTREEALQLTTDDISAEPEKTQKAIKHSSQTGSVFIQGRRHRKKDGTEIYVDFSSGPFTWKGRALMFAIIRNVTDRKIVEAERERLIVDLQKALDEINTLRGFIPICSSCKKIRDDQGYWHQVEEYIRDHSQAEFTHSICQSCAQKLYPEIISVKDNR